MLKHFGAILTAAANSLATPDLNASDLISLRKEQSIAYTPDLRRESNSVRKCEEAARSTYLAKAQCHSPPRMRVRMHFAQMSRLNAGIDLRGRKTGMPQQGLNRPQVRAVLQQVCCKAVAQGVRGGGFG